MLQINNIGTLLMILNYFSKTNIVEQKDVIYFGVLLAIVFLALNYFTLYSKRCSIFVKFEGMSKFRRTKGKIFFWLYIILTFAFFFGVGNTLGYFK